MTVSSHWKNCSTRESAVARAEAGRWAMPREKRTPSRSTTDWREATSASQLPARETTSRKMPMNRLQRSAPRAAKTKSRRARERMFRDSPSFPWSHRTRGDKAHAARNASRKGAKRERSVGPRAVTAQQTSSTNKSRRPSRNQSRPRSGQESSFMEGPPLGFFGKYGHFLSSIAHLKKKERGFCEQRGPFGNGRKRGAGFFPNRRFPA